MNKTMKKNVVVSAVLAIVLCVSLIAGATFALFTSESDVNIVVTSGKVNVVASIDQDSVETKQYGADYQSGSNYTYGGQISIQGGSVEIGNIMPGDGIKFDIKVANNSTVAVKYRTIVACDGDNTLFDGLNFEIDGEPYVGTTIVSRWDTLEVGSTLEDVSVAIELPDEAGDEYQGKSFVFSYQVAAVQGNATVSDYDPDTYYIYTARDLAALQSATGLKKVEFVNDINMSGVTWNGLWSREHGGIRNFTEDLTIIGNGKYISGLSAPLIRSSNCDVTIDGLTIKDSEMHKEIGLAYPDNLAFAAFVELADSCSCTFTNCKLVDSELTTSEDLRLGAFIGIAWGPASISNCTVSGCELSAFGSIGGIIGQTGDAGGRTYEIAHCTVEDTTLNSTDIGDWCVGSIVGSANAGTTIINNCTSSGNTLKQTGTTASEDYLFGRIKNNGRLIIDGSDVVAHGVSISATGEYLISTAEGLVYCRTRWANGTSTEAFKLTQNIDMRGIVWEPWCNGSYYFNGTFDGDNHEIQNLTINGEHEANDGYAVGFIGRLGSNGGTSAKTLQNVTFVNATVTGNHQVGVAVGYNEFGSVYNVKVVNSTVTATHKNTEQCGDKAGALIGFCGPNSNVSVISCSATGCTVKGARDVGYLIGAAYVNNGTFEDLGATGCTVGDTTDCTDSSAGANINEDVIGRIM